MRENELLTTPAVANTAEQSVQTDNVSIYRFGRSVYKVRTHFNLECTETLADVVDRLIMQDLNDTDN
ncbi:MAG: transposon-encoded TnpW family protein [Ruminiclostridium sp.]|nr:transposon-encoded TnpW family protein [Ruminiclostridium sp.]MBR1833468.1 transposon-encoded TnpW family protein [Ruminiclostridium sp.]